MSEIKPEEVRAKAEELAEVVQAVKAEIPSNIANVALSLPGSLSAGRGTELAGQWEDVYSTLVKEGEFLAQVMRDTAHDWETADANAAVRAQAAGGGF